MFFFCDHLVMVFVAQLSKGLGRYGCRLSLVVRLLCDNR